MAAYSAAMVGIPSQIAGGCQNLQRHSSCIPFNNTDSEIRALKTDSDLI